VRLRNRHQKWVRTSRRAGNRVYRTQFDFSATLRDSVEFIDARGGPGDGYESGITAFKAGGQLTDAPFHLRFLLTPLEVRTGDLFLRQSS
jgi:hypothetical protein